MRNSKSDGWILRVAAAGNQYWGEASRCGAELGAASPSCVASVWKLLQFISPAFPPEPRRRSSHIRTAALTKGGVGGCRQARFNPEKYVFLMFYFLVCSFVTLRHWQQANYGLRAQSSCSSFLIRLTGLGDVMNSHQVIKYLWFLHVFTVDGVVSIKSSTLQRHLVAIFALLQFPTCLVHLLPLRYPPVIMLL